MKSILNKMTFGLSLGILFSVFSITQVLASSHREAPLISNDPLADNTDVYAFRSPDDPNTITIIANYIPMQLPHGGPNYYSFGENIRYEIHIDNDATTPGDDITYRFTFNKVNEDPTTFFNIRLGAQNQKNTYTMEKSTDGGQTFTTVVENGVVPAYNVGDRSIEGAAGLGTTYEDLFNSAITSIGDGESVFCGHIEDPFFVNLAGIFDLGDAPSQNGPSRDGLACMNVSTIAIKINISDLQKDGKSVDQAENILDGDFVIGVWASASRQQIRTLNSDGTQATDGDWVQVSRLGMPLTNEVVIAIGDKDYWNSITPYDELGNATLDAYFYNPELALYMDEDNFASAVPAFAPLRIQRNSLQSFDFGNGQDGLFPLKGTAALDGTVLAAGSPYEDLLLPGAGQPRSVDLWPIFHTGVPNARPYQLATGKEGDPLAAGKPFINNFLPNGGDMLRLNMATPVTQRDDPAFSSLGLIQAAVLGLTDPAYANTDLEFIPNMDGFPNGRRLEDDVTRIELQAVAGVVLDAIGLWEDDYNPEVDDSPVTAQLLAELTYSTGVDANDVPFRSTFPYVQLPFTGDGPCSGKAIEYVQPAILEPTAIVTSVCDNFSYFLSDHDAIDGISDIYKVNIEDGVANLQYIATSPIEVHIAFNSVDNLIYAVSKHENSYRTLDPTSGLFGPTQDLGGDYGELTAAVFNVEGKLLIGSQNNNAIYSVNVATNEVSVYDSFSPVTGGDLAFASDGMLYLATRSSNGLLFENYPEGTMPDQFIGSVPSNVTGLAITDLDNLLVSARGNTSIEVRGTDGSDPHVGYPVMLNGEPYTLRDGDMASGCNTGIPLEGQCDSFTTWYVNHGPGIGGSDLYTVEFTTGGFANLSYVTNVDFEAHIAFNAGENITYLVDADGSVIRAYDVITNTFVVDLPLTGADFTKITAVIYNPADNMLYIGDDNLDAIYAVDVNTGSATFYASAPVSGGDLAILADGSLYLATRTGNSLYKIVEGGDAELVNNIPALVTGMARGNDVTSLFLSNKGANEFTQIMASDGSPMATYTAMLGGTVFTLSNGDMAAGCADPGLSVSGCYGDEVLEFEQGLQTNGSAVADNRSDASQALGEPDRSNAVGGFVSLGVDGHITIGFAGVVNDAPGNDIRIFETSYTGDVCGASDDESADIELSADGVNFVSVGSICRDGEVDMADAGLSSVVAIRITTTSSTGTLDGYDVDGVEAINGCTDANDDGDGDLIAVEAQTMLTSYPNPTSGASEVVFHIASTSRTMIDVYDMNGRKVASLFDEVAKSDQEYRLNFNGSDLPNGIYIYRMTTNDETIVNKFMIAK